MRELNVSLPSKLKIVQDSCEQFLLSVAGCAGPISFEVIGTSNEVSLQFACTEVDQNQLEQQLGGYFPEAVVYQRDGFLRELWGKGSGSMTITEYGLASEFMRPLALFRSFEPDPLTAVIAALSTLRAAEVAVLQFTFMAATSLWADSILRSLTDNEGKPFFIGAPELLPLARQKISRPLFAVVIRLSVRSSSTERSKQISKRVESAFHQFCQPSSNELVPLSNQGYPLTQHADDLLGRATRRTGVLLNSKLAGFVHLPSATVQSEKFRRQTKKTRPAPVLALGHSLVLGHNNNRGRTVPVTLSAEQRMRHVFVAGATGSGKSTLLKSMAAQDIRNGDGCCVIDPHADLINDLLSQVPEDRYRDVIVFDPSDECPVPFNVMSAHSELEKNLLASDLTSIFRRQSTTWGDQMDTVLTNSILSFWRATEPALWLICAAS